MIFFVLYWFINYYENCFWGYLLVIKNIKIYIEVQFLGLFGYCDEFVWGNSISVLYDFVW